MHQTGQPTRSSRSQSPLVWFVALSLLLHLPLLLTLKTATLTIGEVARTLQLTLAPAPSTTSPTEPRHATATKQIRPHPKPEAMLVRKVAVEVTPLVPTLTTSTAPATNESDTAATDSPTATDDNEGAQQAVLTGRLQLALASHFSYPLLARKKGWEGEVMLAFRINPDGTISGARITHGSGHGALDRAALGALNKVGRIDTPPLQGLSLEIPVIYRLQEG